MKDKIVICNLKSIYQTFVEIQEWYPSPWYQEKVRGDLFMKEPERISADEVYQKLKSGTVLLVCAYEDEAPFKKMQLEGAISFDEFRSKLPSLSKDQEIVFYWAWAKEASAAGQAAKYIAKGFKNAKALSGGVEAWNRAGYPVVESK